ncbi:MAG TPA: hypothetical protein VIO60_02010 [Rectinemataceae bacterium]
MQSAKIIVGTYNSLPESCSDRVFELNYQRSWRPYLSSLYKFPTVGSVIHYSGTVLSWIEEHHPEFILLLEEMSSRKQIELLGGCFFSPLASLIPTSDKIGQVEMLTTYLRKSFGRRPSGGWLHDYAWDQDIPLAYRNAGLTYTFLPQNELAEAGVCRRGDYQPLVAESQRRVIHVLPVAEAGVEGNEALCLEVLAERLISLHPEQSFFTIMLDGSAVPELWEASGAESPDLLFERSFAWFQKNCLTVETTLAQNVVKGLRSCNGFYLPSLCSGRLVDCLNDPELKPNRTASIRQVLLADKEVRRLYDKMCHIHTVTALLRGDKARKKSAQEDLWRAQRGNLYRPIGLGSLSDPKARVSAYNALVQAEKTSRSQGSFTHGILLDDFDCDGQREVLYQASDLNCYIHQRGGAVFELDSLKSKWDYCAVHAPGLDGEARCFVDSLSAFGDFSEERHLLGDIHYSLNEKEKSLLKISFSKDLSLGLEGCSSLGLKKSYLFQKHALSVDFEVYNRSTKNARFRFSSEINLQPAYSLDHAAFFSVQARMKAPLIAIAEGLSHNLKAQGTAEAIFVQNIQGRETVEIRSDSPFCFELLHRIDPALSSERGLGIQMASGEESIMRYQGTRIAIGWDIGLEPDASAVRSLTLRFGP